MGNSLKISLFCIRGMIIILLTAICNCLAAQTIPSPVSPLPKSVTTKFAAQNNNDLYNTQSVFIENIGQYGETMKGYDRYGQMIFTTKKANTGWDGKIKGVEQDPGVFIWMAKAIDFKGYVVLRKGTVTLIR